MPCSLCNEPGHNKRTCGGVTPKLEQPSSSTDEMQGTQSKNSLVAKSGFQAEDLACTSLAFREALSTFFGKPIQRIEKVPGRKKSDNRVVFEDGTQVRLQIKNGTGGGRGWSFDRRSVESLPTTNNAIKSLAKAVCLKDGERTAAANDKEMIKALLLGTEEDFKPQFIVHTTIKEDKIVDGSICTAEIFVDSVLKDAFELCVAKRTCVHLTPLIYIQRKGGGTKDHSPNDVQCKLRGMPDCMTSLTLQTISLQQEQTPE